MERKLKRCPYCGKEILSVANKCRYCGMWISGDDAHLMRCPSCGERIDKRSKTCPYCSEPISAHESDSPADNGTSPARAEDTVDTVSAAGTTNATSSAGNTAGMVSSAGNADGADTPADTTPASQDGQDENKPTLNMNMIAVVAVLVLLAGSAVWGYFGKGKPQGAAPDTTMVDSDTVSCDDDTATADPSAAESSDQVLELAEQNPRIVGVTPAMPSGCSMNIMMKEMPERTFDVGIAEGHAVTFSGGMAKDGLLPFCNIYSAFAQRAFDNIIHDVALLNLNMVFCFDRAGLVGEDGPTHHGAFDLAALRPIPNLTISSPMDEHELRRLMYTAQLPDKGPFVIRYPRGGGVLQDWRCPLEEVKVGTGRKMHEGTDVAVLSIGPIGNNVTEAIEKIGNKVSVAHYDMRFLKPIDEEILEEVGRKFKRVITLENGVKKGGLGSAVLEWMNEHDYHPKVTILGMPDEFVEHGTVAELQKIVGFDTESIIKAITEA